MRTAPSRSTSAPPLDLPDNAQAVNCVWPMRCTVQLTNVHVSSNVPSNVPSNAPIACSIECSRRMYHRVLHQMFHRTFHRMLHWRVPSSVSSNVPLNSTRHGQRAALPTGHRQPIPLPPHLPHVCDGHRFPNLGITPSRRRSSSLRHRRHACDEHHSPNPRTTTSRRHSWRLRCQSSTLNTRQRCYRRCMPR